MRSEFPAETPLAPRGCMAPFVVDMCGTGGTGGTFSSPTPFLRLCVREAAGDDDLDALAPLMCADLSELSEVVETLFMSG